VFGRARRGNPLDVDASRFRQPSRDRDASSGKQEFTVTCDVGGFGSVKIPWLGVDEVDAGNSFLDYLFDDEAYGDVEGRHPNIRMLYVRFNGQPKLLTFRTDWIAGFTVH